MSIPKIITRLQQRIAVSALHRHINPSDITLMAVTKTVEPDHIRQAYSAGLRVLGESRVQEFAAKVPLLRDLPGAEWHMIGHLQTNKVATAVELFDVIDSLDSVRLAEKINFAAGKLEKKISVLIEINVGGESAKTGVQSDSPGLENLLRSASNLEHLEFRGLMTVPPFAEDPEKARPYFRKLRELRDQIAARQLPRVDMDVLSMGMSHDFEVAIEEGSTCVRIGTAIFGERNLDTEGN